jgi:hypothetical protein
MLSLLPYLLAILAILYLVCFDKEWSWKPKRFLENKKNRFRKKKYEKFLLDEKLFLRLNTDVQDIELELDTLKKPPAQQ